WRRGPQKCPPERGGVGGGAVADERRAGLQEAEPRRTREGPDRHPRTHSLEARSRNATMFIRLPHLMLQKRRDPLRDKSMNRPSQSNAEHERIRSVVPARTRSAIPSATS